MGRPKALLPLGPGETFLTRIVETLRAGGVDDVVVVGGADAGAIAASLARSANPPRLAVNSEWATGQLSSVIAALKVIDHPGVDAMLLTLIDLPLVSPQTVRALIETHRQTRAPIVRPARAGRHGHPVIFDRSVFDELRRADPMAGPKAVVHAHLDAAIDVQVGDEGAFADIDTPEDYERFVGRPLSGAE